MDKKPIGYVKGQANPLDKKVKSNVKYAGVQKKLNTGLTVRNIEVISNSLIAKRKGENFNRVKGEQLQILLEEETNTESIYNIKEEEREENMSVNSKMTSNTQITSKNQQDINLAEQSEFILVDTRESDEYNQYHIVQSINLPSTMINQDKWHPQVTLFKNKEDKLIIIYHLDEKNGVKIASNFFEKGFDNIYLLTGGIEEFSIDCHHLLEGPQLPQQKTKPKADVKIQKRSNYKEPVNQILNTKDNISYKDNMSELSQQFDRQSINSKVTKK